jgi:hypothetical protein
METSDMKPAIHEALSNVMEEVKSVAKNDRNDAQRFNFRGIDAVMNAVGPAFRKHGVIALPEVLEHTYSIATSSKGTPMGHVLVRVAYTFIGPAGDSLTCSVAGEAMDIGDKATPKAMSVAFRTALLQALTLPTNETDPDAESYERGSTQPKALPKPSADGNKVPDLVARFTDAESIEDLAAISQEIALLDISSPEKETLRRAYMASKSRVEGP